MEVTAKIAYMCALLIAGAFTTFLLGTDVVAVFLSTLKI